MNEKITREYVDSLPIKEVNMGGVRKSVRFDEVSRKIYALDERGRWNGTVKEIPANIELSKVVGTSVATPKTNAAPSNENKNTSDFNDQSSVSNTDDSKSQKTPSEEQTDSELTSAPEKKNMPELKSQQTAMTPGDIFSSEEIVSEIPDKEEVKEKSSSVVTKILFGAAIVALIAVVIMTVLGSRIASQNQNPSGSGLESTMPVTQPPVTQDIVPETSVPFEQTDPPEVETTVAPTEPPVMIAVLSPMGPIIPGQAITSDLLEIREIPENDYRVLSSSAGLYTADDLMKLEGLLAQSYIPAGRYLTYDDVGRSYGSVNPWEGEYNGYKYIKLPVSPVPENLTYFNWASSVSLTITVQTKQTNDNTASSEGAAESTEPTDPDGMEHESSVLEAMVIDTYRLSDVRVADLQNALSESLYSRYYSIASIPSAFQMDYLMAAYADRDSLLRDIPAYIVICVNDAQYKQLSALPQDIMTVEVSAPSFVSGTALQNETYALLRDAQTVIAEAWKQAEKVYNEQSATQG